MTQVETIVDHHHVGNEQSNSHIGFVIGAIIFLITIFFFFMYGLPMIQSSMQRQNINVPDKVDVNINK